MNCVFTLNLHALQFLVILLYVYSVFFRYSYSASIPLPLRPPSNDFLMPSIRLACVNIQGKLALAVDAYEKAQTAAPNFAIVHINLAIALTEMGTHAKMSGELM